MEFSYIGESKNTKKNVGSHAPRQNNGNYCVHAAIKYLLLRMISKIFAQFCRTPQT